MALEERLQKEMLRGELPGFAGENSIGEFAAGAASRKLS